LVIQLRGDAVAAKAMPVARTAVSRTGDSDRRAVSRRRLLYGGLAAGVGLLLAPRAARPANGPIITVVYFDDFAPFSLLAADGTAHGLLVDAIDAIGYGRLGWTARHQAMPWGRAQLKVEKGDADAFCTLPTPRRQEYCRFTGKPLLNLLVDGLIWRRGGPQAAQLARVSRLEDLQSLVIADYIGNGWSQTHLAGWTNVQRRGSLEEAIRLVESGAADVLIQSLLITRTKLRQMGLDDRFTGRVVDFLPQSPAPFHFGLRRSLAGHEALIAAFEAAQRDFLSGGAMTALVQRYTGA
jgi:polar amino acid transport system substrate-binding protein